MTPARQKKLAITAALAAILVFLAANAHLLSVAFSSAPACTARADAAPARRAC
ncbi:MAG: hypothetical protein ACK5M4_08850 [Pseudorhodobacter sp.]